MKDADVIVIGSGAGGLAAAVALARAGRRVLVLEQHYLPGGWCHSFNLGGYRFSPGVHYVGELHEGGSMRAIYEGLGVAGDLPFFELNRDGYDHVILGNERFDIPSGKQRYAERLKSRFPKEASGIDRWLDTNERIIGQLAIVSKLKKPLDAVRAPFIAPDLLRWGLRPTSHLMRACTKDPLLQGILGAQWGDQGLPPSLAPAVVHAMVVTHYFEGGYYPQGGGRAIPRAFVRALKRAGGDIRLRASVESILVEGSGADQRAVGVRLADGSELRADIVLSNADPAITYGKLVPQSALPTRVTKKLGRTRWSTSCLSLFAATDLPLDRLGYDSGNYWYNDSADVEAGWQTAATPGGADAETFPGQFVTVTTLKDRTKPYPGVHTLESFVFVHPDSFHQWDQSSYGERPDEYKAYKARLTERLVRGAARVIPNLDRHIVFAELGTPLTNRHYVAATAGNLYGTEKSAFQIGPFGWRQRSPIAGLYLCGASTFGHGVMGATLSGLQAAAMIQGCSRRELLRGGEAPLRVQPADALPARADEVSHDEDDAALSA